MNRTEEWRDIYNTPIGSSVGIGIYNNNTSGQIMGYRVPGGIIYKTIEDRTEINSRYDNYSGGMYNDNRPAISVAMIFVPFPMGLYEKLSAL